MARKPDLDSNEMLQQEFKYISQTAFQANEDRSRVTSFYFVSVGSLVAAIIGTQLEPQQKTVSFAFFARFLNELLRSITFLSPENENFLLPSLLRTQRTP